MRVLITGATGYIGTWLARRATESGWEAHALVRRGSNRTRLPAALCVWTCDGGIQSVIQCVSAVQPDAVIHLASIRESGRSPLEVENVISANLLLGAQVLEAMRMSGCRCLVNAGSYWEYDSGGSYAPDTLYAATKHAFQDLILYYCRAHGFRALTLVLYDVYGPGDWRGKVVSQLVDSLRSGQRVSATEGDQNLYLNYIDDVCRGFLHAAREMPEPAGHHIYALRADKPVRLKDLAARLQSAAGRALNVGWGELPYRAGQILQPVSSIPLLPGWESTTSLEQGLLHVVAELEMQNL